MRISHFDELEADFQETYNLDIATVPASRAARLMFQLPRKSRLFRKLYPEGQYDEMDMVAIAQMNSLSFLAWTKTKAAAKKGAKPPKPYLPPAIEKAQKKANLAKKDVKVMSVDDVKALLARPRTAVK